MEKGKLIEFRLHGDRRLAVVDRPKDKKHWVVIDEQGQPHTVSPRQVSYEVSGSYQPSDIPGFHKTVAAYLDPEHLEVAWEYLVEEGKGIEPGEMAELLFSSKEAAECYAAYCLLSDDKLYFKCKGDRYEPRSAEQVAELKHQQEVETQRQQEVEGFRQRVQRALTGELVVWESSDRPRIEALERFATLGEEAPSKHAKEVLATLGRSETADEAFLLLVQLGIWSHHENLFLRRSQIPIQFSAKVLDVVCQLLASPPADPDEGNRLDLTGLKLYTIDDESTREIDDGLSCELLEDGRERIWIHIADPTRWVMPGDTLDLEARRRSTTVYLPTETIPMFPEALATGPMSLLQGKVCTALSFGVVLDETGAIAEYTIRASQVLPTYRLTYEDVDEMLELRVEQEPEISALHKWATLRRTWRSSQGAISIHMPECSVKVKGEDIIIDLVDDSHARAMVAEMMILAGEVAATYACEHELPIPFRFQAQPELPPNEELLLLPAGPVRSCAVRRCMPRSEIGITPSRHASLGLERYTQATSPIRRYSDLLVHFQIKAHLRGETLPFAAAEVQEVMASVSMVAKEAIGVERQTNRYWSLEYLRRHTDQGWQALMLRWLREDEGLGLILLEELGLEMAMRFQRGVKPGDRLAVKVAYADPRQDLIHFQELSQTVASAVGS